MPRLDINPPIDHFLDIKYIAMTEECISTAAAVTLGEKGDGPELPKLLEASQENGMEIDTIIGDAAYSGKENLKLAEKQNIRIVVRLNPLDYLGL